MHLLFEPQDILSLAQLLWMSSSGTELWLTSEDMQNVMYAGPNEGEG